MNEKASNVLRYTGYYSVTGYCSEIVIGKPFMDKVTSCPVETTIGVIGGRWKVLIIHCLIKKTMRFGEIARVLDGISARSLSKQLRELEEDGVIVRKDFEEALPRVEYSLTTLGQSLESVLLAMEAWGIRVEETRRRCT